MVYKKYIKRNGKVFGPYYCHSYRDKDGKVRTKMVKGTERRAKPEKVKTPFLFGLVILVAFLVVLSGAVFYSLNSEKISGFLVEGEEGEGASEESAVEETVEEVVEEEEEAEEEAEEVAIELEEVSNETEEEVLEGAEGNETEIVEEGNVTEIITNETASEGNETLSNVTVTNETLVNESVGNQSAVENATTIINETVLDELTNVSFELQEEVTQYGAVLGRPVKWEKKVRVISEEEKATLGELTIELPELADNVSVKKVDKQGEEDELVSSITPRKAASVQAAAITGGMIQVLLRHIFQGLQSITGFVVDVVENAEEVTVDVEEEIEEGEEVVVEYYTEAPYAEEREIEEGKEITIIGPEEVHYEDVLAFSELPEQVVSANNVNLYWIVNGSRTVADFEVYDGDEDGLYDYVEWVVPHLSEQIYELIIINITKAVHLDSNRSVIGDVFDYVSVKDGIWLDNISDGEYLRVTFEEELDHTKDITLYARGINGSVEVYEEDGDELLATFENVSVEDWYKIYLTNMAQNHTQDVFDLKVIGEIDFDYVVDPQANDSWTVYTCGTIDVAGVYTLNQSIIPQITTGSCINITTQNVTLDCAGQYIFNDTLAISGIYSDQINTTIKGCNVTMKYPNDGPGIELNSANNSHIFNNTLNNQSFGLKLSNVHNILIENNTLWSNLYGIRLYPGSNNTIQNNSIKFNTNAAIRFRSADNNTIFNNTMYSNGRAISFLYSSNNNVTDSDIWNCSGTNCGSGCLTFAENSNSNLISGGIINLSTTNIINLVDGDYCDASGTSSNNIFRDLILLNAGENDTYVADSSINNTFINVTYNISKEYVKAGSELIRKWYLDVNASYRTNLSAVQGANITGFNNTPTQLFTLLTGANGLITRQQVEEYTNNGTDTYYDTNYTIYGNVTNVGLVNVSKPVNITTNTLVNVYFGVCPSEMLGSGTEAAPCQALNCDDDPTVGSFFYELQNNITTTESCFNITADNITLDFNQKNITGDDSGTSDYGVDNLGYNSSTIKDGYIYDFYDAIHFGHATTHIPNKNNNITNMVLNSNKGNGIFLDSSQNNSITNVTSVFNLAGIFIWHNASDNFIRDSNFSLSTADFDVKYGFFGSGQGNFNNTFLNVSYNRSKERVLTDNSELIRKWYLDVSVVTGESVAVDGANVSIYNNSGDLESNEAASVAGTIVQKEKIEYVNLGGTRTYWTNYTATATGPGYAVGSEDINLTTNKAVTLSLIAGSDDGGDDEEPEEEVVDEPNETVINETVVPENDTEAVDDLPEDVEEGETVVDIHTGTAWVCGAWSDCKADYSMEQAILEETELEGYLERTCEEKGDSDNTRMEYLDCTLEIPIVANDVDWCNDTYIEVSHADTGDLLSRVKEEKVFEEVKVSKLDISFIETQFGGYCDSCFNGVRDQNEKGIDCGGPDCPACEYYDFWNWLPLVILLCWTIFLLLIIIILVKKERKKKKKEESINKIGLMKNRHYRTGLLPVDRESLRKNLSMKSIISSKNIKKESKEILDETKKSFNELGLD